MEHGLKWERGPVRRQDSPPGRMIGESVTPDGTAWSQVYRTEGGYLLRFPSLADFEIAPDGARVHSWPARELDDDTERHLYLNQALPLALSRRGQLVFHGSAVEVDGEAIVFLGASGRGKSTLAAAFAVRGSRFLTDDGLIIEPRGAEFWVRPSHPSIRLWDDSRDAVIGSGVVASTALRWTAKGRFLAGDRLAFCAEPRRMRTAYFLGEGATAAIEFSRLRWQDALIELVRHSFLLDPEDKELLAAHFERVSSLARAATCWRLDYANGLEGLGAVTRAIVSHARTAQEAA